MKDILNKNILSGKNRLFKRGFTLAELLVVVLVLGILAAIALPAYQRAINRSKVSDALSNLEMVSLKQQDYLLNHEEYASNFKDLNVPIDGLYDQTGAEAQVGNFKYALSEGCVTATYNPKKKDGSTSSVNSKDQYTICRSPEDNTVQCQGGFCDYITSLVPKGSCSECVYTPPNDGSEEPIGIDKKQCTLSCSQSCPNGSSRNGTCKFNGADMYCDYSGTSCGESGGDYCSNGIAYGKEGVGDDGCDGKCDNGTWKSYKSASGKVWNGSRCVSKGACPDGTMILKTENSIHYCMKYENGAPKVWEDGSTWKKNAESC